MSQASCLFRLQAFTYSPSKECILKPAPTPKAIQGGITSGIVQ